MENGRGETVETAVSPEGAAVDTFDWRIAETYRRVFAAAAHTKS